MKCPYCGKLDNKVVDKRDTDNNVAIRRRRECVQCKKRFTTYERVELVNLVVIKKDGTRQAFDRKKIERGIFKACEKRPVDQEKIIKIVNRIERKIRNMETIQVPSKKIGRLVINELKKLDKIAYIRFASVYREFADLGDFQDELKKMQR